MSPNWVEGTVHGPSTGFTDPNAVLDPARASFAPYIRAARIYRCPADRSIYTITNTIIEKVRSYGMNELLAMDPRYNSGPGSYQRGSEIVEPARVFVFVDVEPARICNTTFRIPTSDNERFYNAPGAMHASGAVLSFCDGHSEIHLWKGPINRPVMTPAPHEPLTDFQDSHWLRRRAHHLIKP